MGSRGSRCQALIGVHQALIGVQKRRCGRCMALIDALTDALSEIVMAI